MHTLFATYTPQEFFEHGSSDARIGRLRGTIGYMAPELIVDSESYTSKAAGACHSAITDCFLSVRCLSLVCLIFLFLLFLFLLLPLSSSSSSFSSFFSSFFLFLIFLFLPPLSF